MTSHSSYTDDLESGVSTSVNARHRGRPGEKAALLDPIGDTDGGTAGKQHGATLELLNIKYRIKDIDILKGVSAKVLPGQTLAIIGSSGCGKTTLLDCLTGRKTTGELTGEVYVGGRRVQDTPGWSSQYGYVLQEDCLHAQLTVRETLKFSADIRLPARFTQKDRHEIVEDIIRTLGLEDVADHKIGNDKIRGISGGERKRVSIGVSLVTNPSILFLDEPTTGLDAYNALSVMEHITEQASKVNRTVVCTIHQPRSSIYNLFDQLLLMSKGQVVYFGPARLAKDFFQNNGLPLPEDTNPADFFTDTIVSLEREATAQKLLLGGTISQLIHANTLQHQTEATRGPNSPRTSVRSQYGSSVLPAVIGHKSEFYHATGFIPQLVLLMKREFTVLIRTPFATYVALSQSLFMAFLISSIFWKLKHDIAGIQNRIGMMFFVMTSQAFSNMGSLSLFVEGRTIFQRERAAGMYRPSAYFIAKSITEFPLLVLFPFIFATIIYWCVGLANQADKYLIFTLCVVLITNVASGIVTAVGSVTGNIRIANIIAPIFFVIFSLFAGFYINESSVPVYYRWIREISFFKYGYEAMVVNEFQGSFFGDNCPNGEGCVTGEEQIAKLGMSHVDIQTNIIVLISMFVFFRLVGYIGLKFFNKERR